MPNIERKYADEAERFCAAIKALAANPDALENLNCYLSIHFSAWIEKYANCPENIAGELEQFSKI